MRAFGKCKSILVLVILTLGAGGLPGCAIIVGNTSDSQAVAPSAELGEGYSDVKGFGKGNSKAEAEQAAWNDAVTRIKTLGITPQSIRAVGTEYGTVGDLSARYSATITLRVKHGDTGKNPDTASVDAPATDVAPTDG